MSSKRDSTPSASSVLAERARTNGTLISLQVELTSRCPLACQHCYNDPTEVDSLSREGLRRLFSEAAGLGALFLSFTGGEVFARSDTLDIIKDARRLQYVVRLQTSGWYIDQALADCLADEAVSEVALSVYSADPVVHDAVTRRLGSHARTVAAARALRTRGVRVILLTAVTKVNAATYRTVEVLARELDCQFSMDATILPCESGTHGPCALRPDDSVLRDFYGQYARAQYEADYDRPFREPLRRTLDARPCGVGDTGIVIASDGTAYPCTTLRLPLGNVLSESISDIWTESSTRQRLRQLRWHDLPICAHCPLSYFCQHCCALALIEHGDLTGPALESCRHAVIRRDLLRERGLIPASETELPPPLLSAGEAAAIGPKWTGSGSLGK